MRRDRRLLEDIREASEDITGFLRGQTLEAFLSNAQLRYAVVQRLTTIGEAAGRLTQDLRDRHGELPWREIVALRSVLVHAYFAVKWERIWQTAISEVPDFLVRVSNILDVEFSDGPDCD